MALGGVEDVFVAFVGDAHRAARLEGGQGGVASEHRGVVFLAAEGAAHHGLHDADFLGRQAEGVVELGRREVGALDRAFDADSAVALGGHAEALGFEVELLLVAGAVLALHHAVGGAETGGDVALLDGLLLEVLQRSRVGLEALDAVVEEAQERRERVDRELHRRGGRAGLFGGGGGDDRDGLAAVADFGADGGHQRHRAVVHVHDVLARNVLRRRHRHPMPVEGRILGDALEDAARHVRTHHDAVQRAALRDVAEVLRRAAYLVRRVHAEHLRTDVLEPRGCRLGCLCLCLCHDRPPCVGGVRVPAAPACAPPSLPYPIRRGLATRKRGRERRNIPPAAPRLPPARTKKPRGAGASRGVQIRWRKELYQR